MSLRWYAEERRRTRTFDSPPVDHDFESFRIIFCALRDAERASDISSFSSPLFFFPLPFPPFALTHANYGPSGNRVRFFSLLSSNLVTVEQRRKQRVLISARRIPAPFQDAPTLARSSPRGSIDTGARPDSTRLSPLGRSLLRPLG